MRALAPSLAVVLLLAACGGEEASRGAAKPAVTPFPFIDRADLVAGTTYTTQRFKPRIRLTLPAASGWRPAPTAATTSRSSPP